MNMFYLVKGCLDYHIISKFLLYNVTFSEWITVDVIQVL